MIKAQSFMEAGLNGIQMEAFDKGPSVVISHPTVYWNSHPPSTHVKVANKVHLVDSSYTLYIHSQILTVYSL